jgi:hypothetical protein
MTRIFDQMKQVPAKPAIETLQKLWHSRNQNEQPPYVTVGAGRMSFTGWVCSADFRASDLPFVLVMPGANGNPSDELAYLSGRGVDWLVVHNASDHLETLSEGRIDALANRTPPGKLGLNRKQKEMNNNLQSLTGADLSIGIDWNSVLESEARHMVLAEVTLDMIEQAFKELVTDDLAKEAVRTKVTSVSIAIGCERKFQLTGGVLQIVLDAGSGAAGRFSAAEMKSRLNDVL